MYLLVGNRKKQKQKEIVQILHAEVWTCGVVLCAVTLPCWGLEGRCWLFFHWLKEMSSQKHHDSCQWKLCRWFWSEETLLMLANKRRWWETSYNASCLPGLLGKTLGLQVKREACENSVGLLAENTVGNVTGDAFDFTDEGQESSLASTTLGLQRQPWSSAV